MSYNAERYKSDPEYKARIDANHRKYYNKVKDTPEFKAKNAAAVRKWREENSERFQAYKSTEEYKAKARERVRKWREANPDKIKQYRSTDKYKEYRRAYQQAARQAMSEDQRAAYLEYHREHNKKYSQRRKRYLTDPDYASSLTQVERERIQRSIDNSKASCKEYYANHKSECYARYREWVSKNLERRRELARQSYHRCKARKKAAAEALAGGDTNA